MKYALQYYLNEIAKSSISTTAVICHNFTFPISNSLTFIKGWYVVTATNIPIIAADAPTIDALKFKIE
jgi:hypothetical protein